MIWENLKKPIIGLAPMHSVTNSAFRLECKKFGAEIVYTEMVAAEAIIRNVSKALEMAQFSEDERPIIIQIFGNNPKSLARAAAILEKKFKPNGIDLNFGCPVQKAQKQGFGAIQLNNPEKAVLICRSVKKVLKNTPLSLKMRLVSENLEENLNFIKKIEPFINALAIHGRTLSQLYKGEVNWGLIYQIKENFPKLIILGNGNIKNSSDFVEKIKNLDGVLIGRGAKLNQQIFKEIKEFKDSICR